MNDLTTTQYFRGTNRKGDALKQLLQKRTRLEYYRINSTAKILNSKTTMRKIRTNDFFQQTDLYMIPDLNQIDQLIHGDDPIQLQEALEDELDEEIIKE